MCPFDIAKNVDARQVDRAKLASSGSMTTSFGDAKTKYLRGVTDAKNRWRHLRAVTDAIMDTQESRWRVKLSREAAAFKTKFQSHNSSVIQALQPDMLFFDMGGIILYECIIGSIFMALLSMRWLDTIIANLGTFWVGLVLFLVQATVYKASVSIKGFTTFSRG